MQRMKLQITVVGAPLACLIAASCAARQPVEVPVNLQSNEKLKVYFTHAYALPGEVVIYGNVRRARGNAGRVDGHLHITARGRDGMPVLVSDAKWGGFEGRWRWTAPYTAKLRLADPSIVSSIQIEARSAPD